MKISHKLCNRMDGTQFWCFPWFAANSLLCVILRVFYVYWDKLKIELGWQNVWKSGVASINVARRCRFLICRNLEGQHEPPLPPPGSNGFYADISNNHQMGQHGILIFSCLLFVLFKKINPDIFVWLLSLCYTMVGLGIYCQKILSYHQKHWKYS